MSGSVIRNVKRRRGSFQQLLLVGFLLIAALLGGIALRAVFTFDHLMAQSAGFQARALQLTAAAAPREEDQVVEAAGARVFLEPQAAAYLADKVLDAQFDEQGTVQFSLGRQGGGQG